jgi:hypothetical protein
LEALEAVHSARDPRAKWCHTPSQLKELQASAVAEFEQGEDWNWCYIDALAFLVHGIRDETRIPPSPLMS